MFSNSSLNAFAHIARFMANCLVVLPSPATSEMALNE